MSRLFVALDLPKVVSKRLAKSQPLPLPGIRLVDPGQIHITLHFIGEAAVEPIVEALQSIKYTAFRVTIKNGGQFKTSDGGLILWAGVNKSTELAGLYTAVGSALAETGIKIEKRSYAPHITLARCNARAAARLSETQPWSLKDLFIPEIPITSFVLYSSSLTKNGAEYQVEKSFAMKKSALRSIV